MSRAITVLAVVCALMLTGCGNDEAPPTEAPASESPTRSASLTVGDLLLAMGKSWAEVASMRITSWDSANGTMASPDPTGSMTIEEFVRPSSRRVSHIVGGSVIDEQIVVDGHIFMKGSLVPAAIAPMVDTSTWIEVDTAAATSDTPIAGLIAYLLQPVNSPLGSVTTETRVLDVRPGDSIEVAGRTCQLYSFDGEGALDYDLAIDERGLPCMLTITAANQASMTTWEFDIPGLTISAPSAATPPA